jgi:hypothetical protein
VQLHIAIAALAALTGCGTHPTLQSSMRKPTTLGLEIISATAYHRQDGRFWVKVSVVLENRAGRSAIVYPLYAADAFPPTAVPPLRVLPRFITMEPDYHHLSGGETLQPGQRKQFDVTLGYTFDMPDKNQQEVAFDVLYAFNNLRSNVSRVRVRLQPL